VLALSGCSLLRPLEDPSKLRSAGMDVMRLDQASDVAVVITDPETVIWKYRHLASHDVKWVSEPEPDVKVVPIQMPPDASRSAKIVPPVSEVQSATVHFGFARADIDDEGRKELDRIGGASATAVKIDAHTDSIGSDAYNDKLSRLRGHAVADEMKKHGTPEAVIAVHPMGKTVPIADNTTEAGRAVNRRAEVTVVRTNDATR
jgi:outer membrane protein OmpA-like peptidoglycan-associated protein